ncbi:hypothetical protein V6N11_056367 [Hibiscus sabdariffa]|uniref:Uncharacterized protein n=1 Tax=Hibiscus sabdariffa TaxID=183260 RepID=A0ABR2T3V3_9ROSI
MKFYTESLAHFQSASPCIYPLYGVGEQLQTFAQHIVVYGGPQMFNNLKCKVNFFGMVDDEFLERLKLVNGTRKVVNYEERGRVLWAMDGCNCNAAAGGSLSDNLVALASLHYKSMF